MKGKRIAAAIIDSIIIFFVITVSSSIISLIVYSILYVNNYLISILLTCLLPLLICFIYYTLLPYLLKGSTIGKLIVGIKVVSLIYKKPTFLQLFIRNIFFFETLLSVLPILFLYFFHSGETLTVIISLLVGFIGLGINLVIFIMILSTEEERGLHDHIAKTCVVSRRFDIDKITEANALERSQMDWAIFEDAPTSQNPDDSNPNNDDDDQIEILK